MKKIAVITDTDSSLPGDIAARYGIRQVPITIHFDSEVYSTSVDIDDAGVFEKIDRLKKLPTTSAPSPGAFAAAYEEAFQAGADSIVCICVSSKISATYNSALNACESFPGREIRVVDSMSLSMGQGFMVLAAVEAAQAGASIDQVVASALDIGQRVHLYAVLSTLKYLALSGRVSKIVAGIADTINIKPILTIKEGKLELLERVRTSKKAIDRLMELTRQSVNGQAIERAAVIHVTHPQGASDLQQILCRQLPCPDQVITAEFSAGLSVHAGSGVVGLVVVSRGK